jgi:hypothetical protein
MRLPFTGARSDVAARSAARSTDTAPNDLARLAKHAEAIVRRAVAANPSTPRPALERLAKDADPQVRVALAANPAASAQALRTLAGGAAAGGFDGVARRKALLAVLDHPNATPDLVRRLASDVDPLVARRAAARTAV